MSKANEVSSSELLVCPMAQELKDRLKYFYMLTDGSYEFPNSREGDLLRMLLKFLNGKTDHRKAD